ncbi:lycopene cyclase domain-containing protein [Hydrobacter penzbergensis]|nr:lycopene cyclase domain-containing protein [Hydrobacter penzbergensis]
MMQSYTYLLVNFFTIIICLIASFDKRIQFYKYFGDFLLSSTIVAVLYILWDVWFTKMGVWWFDRNYTLGIVIAGLPLEEWLFFWCIPFACVFTYFCLEKFFDLGWANSLNNLIVFTSSVVLVVIAFLHYQKTYTLITALVTLCVLIFLHFIAKKEWIGQASFVFFVLLLGFIPVNGVLTGTCIESPVVNYNPGDFLGIKILTIPIEDVVYGYSQFLLNIYFFKLFQKQNYQYAN